MSKGADLAARIEAAGHDPDAVMKFSDPGFDRAAVGMTHDGRLVYDYALMVRQLAEDDGISEEEAAEFVDYNSLRSLPYMGPGAPMVFCRFEEDADE